MSRGPADGQEGGEGVFGELVEGGGWENPEMPTCRRVVMVKAVLNPQQSQKVHQASYQGSEAAQAQQPKGRELV